MTSNNKPCLAVVEVQGCHLEWQWNANETGLCYNYGSPIFRWLREHNIGHVRYIASPRGEKVAFQFFDVKDHATILLFKLAWGGQ